MRYKTLFHLLRRSHTFDRSYVLTRSAAPDSNSWKVEEVAEDAPSIKDCYFFKAVTEVDWTLLMSLRNHTAEALNLGFTPWLRQQLKHRNGCFGHHTTEDEIKRYCQFAML